VRAQRIPEIWPSIVTAGWGNGVDTAAKGARKFEVMGQRDDACLAAVGTAVDFHRAIGYENIEARTMELAAALKAGLWKINKLKPVTPADPKLSGGVVITTLSDADSAKMRTLISGLYDKYGIAAVATGGLRLSPHVYNSMDDIELAVRGVRELLA
jgi:isopenicillin-N epimerase